MITLENNKGLLMLNVPKAKELKVDMIILKVKQFSIILISNPHTESAHKRPFALAFFDNNSNEIVMTVGSFISEKTALKKAIAYNEQLELGKSCFEASMALVKK